MTHALWKEVTKATEQESTTQRPRGDRVSLTGRHRERVTDRTNLGSGIKELGQGQEMEVGSLGSGAC